MKVLAVAVHPDDETLGCGGTLLRHARNGDSLHWLVITSVQEPDFSPERARLQEQQVASVRDAYGFSSLHWLKLPSTRLDALPLNHIVAAIREAVQQIMPEIVYAPNRSDAHSDHRVTFEALLAVIKSFYMTSLGVRRILACEVPSETDAAPPLAERAFTPNVFSDISDSFQRKMDIMSLFGDQVQPGFWPRGASAIEALARHRGAAVGVQYAEAFMLLRELV